MTLFIRCKDLIVLLVFLLFGTSALQAQTGLPARFSSDVYASDHVFGQANALLPVSGDAHRALYLNPQVAYGADGQGYLDLGLGYRWLHNCNTLWGVYLFGGYSKIAEDSHLWIVNPGVEILQRRWDARINGYWTSEKNQNLGYWFGYQIGRKELQLKGYQVYDNLYFLRQRQGQGVDARVGYQPWDQIPLKASLGSYFFAPDKIKNVVGGVAELEYWLDRHFKLLVSYNYDNVRHSIGSIGLGIELGGARRERTVPQCIQERITDPVERNLAQQGQGSGVISQNTNYFVGPYPLKRYQYDEANHGGGGGPNPGEPDPEPPTEPPPPPPPPGEIASLTYFSNTGSPNDGSPWTENSGRCTVESPCGPNDFTQANVDFINNALPGASLYFSQGTYPISGDGTLNSLELIAGQGIYGRTLDYADPAPLGERPVFEGRLQLNSNNTVSDVKVILPVSGDPNGSGINFASGAVNVVIQNSQIGSENNPSERFNSGIGSGGSAPFSNRAVMENVTIFAVNTGISVGGPSLMVRDSVINVGETSTIDTTGVRSTGQNATIALERVNINVNSTANASLLIGLRAGFVGTTMIADQVMINLQDTSPLGAVASALYVGVTNNTQPLTRLEVNGNELTATSVNGSAYITNSENTAGNLAVIDIASGVLSAEAPTAEIRRTGSVFDLTIDPVVSCFINNNPASCT